MAKFGNKGLTKSNSAEEIEEFKVDERKEKKCDCNREQIRKQRKIGQYIMAIGLIKNEQSKNFSSLKGG